MVKFEVEKVKRPIIWNGGSTIQFYSPISEIELVSFDSFIWVDILEIAWMTLNSCKVISFEKRLIYVYDNIKNKKL